MGIEHRAAHNEALKRIQLAHKSDAWELCLADLALERLPEELSKLTGITTLRVDGCFELKDISSLQFCTHLTVLDLRACPQVVDLNPLRELHALRELHLGVRDWTAVHVSSKECQSELDDIDALTDLAALETLTLRGCKHIQDLQPLTALTALQTLDLYECDQVHDLQPLTALTGLKKINLYDTGLLDCTPAAQPLASWSQLEQLCANRLIAAPLELGSGDSKDNALPRIRGWQQDLAMGEAPNSTVKLYVLGNGRVGKTQICRRLCREPFDDSIPSTHGIRLGQLQLVAARGDQPAVDAKFWDFGGQDIYLGTHALFLDERAIYVIAWNPYYEGPEGIQESEPPGGFLRNRPLTYWLEYVLSLAGPQAPVIVVQTQCERELDVRPAPMPVAEHGFEWLRVTWSSAKLDDGMERLQLELKSAARYLLERYGKVRLPAGWVALSEELRSRSRQKTLPRDEFNALCCTKCSVS